MPVEPGNLSIAKSTPNRTDPPLTKPQHVSIVQSHFRIQAPNSPTLPAQSNAKLWFLAGHQPRLKTANHFECRQAHQSIAATSQCITNGGRPFSIAETIVNRSVRVTLP